jgi:hypothetical protein
MRGKRGLYNCSALSICSLIGQSLQQLYLEKSSNSYLEKNSLDWSIFCNKVSDWARLATVHAKRNMGSLNFTFQLFVSEKNSFDWSLIGPSVHAFATSYTERA